MDSTQPNGAALSISELVKPYAKKLETKADPNDILSGLWLDLSANIPEPQPLLKQGSANICTKGNFSCITGPAKSRKTYLISGMVGALLCDDEFLGLSGTNDTGTVLYIDTEQSLPHVQRVIRRIHRIADFDTGRNNDRLRVLCLRELKPEDRISAVREGIRRTNPAFCVIDGVGDMMNDTNSNTEAVAIATLLLQITTQYDCHILTAIHTNPGTDKARGHIGSEVIRKAETVISVRKDGDTSRVTATYCRDVEFQEFAFIINDEGLPELTDVPASTSKSIELENLFAEILPLPQTDTHNNLKSKVTEKLGCAEKTARRRISDATECGILVKNEAGYYHLRHKTANDDETLPF